MPRKRTGSIYWTKSGARARLTVTIDGETVQKSYDLETHDELVARAKLRRLLASTEAPEETAGAAPMTVSEYAAGWIERRKGLGIRAADYEARYLERVWGPAIGRKALGDVTKTDVQRVLDACATGDIRPKPRKDDAEAEPYSRQSVAHIRATIVRLFKAAHDDDLISDNKAAKAKVPDMDDEQKPRAVLADEEIGRLVACPEVDAEIKVLVLLSRTVGGLRAGDLNALDWAAFGPDFATCTFRRRKTRKKRPGLQTLVVPEAVRPFLAVWHENQGRPEAGPVFPVRRGPRAGEAKADSNMSYAARLRRELLRAGVTRRELHAETPTTLPVDFHSTRRAYATALARVGVNEQTAMVLTGHADGKTHRRYVEQATIRELPPEAVPRFSMAYAETLRRNRRSIRNPASFPERDTRLELATPSLGSSCSTN